MSVNVIETNGIPVISLTDEAHSNNAPKVNEIINNYLFDKTKKIIIDLKDLKFISTPLMCTLVEMTLKMKQFDSKLVIINMSENIRGLFSVANLLEIVEVFENIKEALIYLNQADD